jgi:hypothetical protein
MHKPKHEYTHWIGQEDEAKQKAESEEGNKFKPEPDYWKVAQDKLNVKETEREDGALRLSLCARPFGRCGGILTSNENAIHR